MRLSCTPRAFSHLRHTVDAPHTVPLHYYARAKLHGVAYSGCLLPLARRFARARSVALLPSGNDEQQIQNEGV